MAANRSSVDEFIRFEEYGERKSSTILARAMPRCGGVEVRRDPRIRGDNIDFCHYAARSAARVCLHARIHGIYSSKVLFIL